MCGLFGIYNNEDAARLTYLGLYALQHRGQEAAGIASTNGRKIFQQRGLELVSDVFTDASLGKLKGSSAIGHVRYSTAGDIKDRTANIQPFVADGNFGQLAFAHNGNLPDAKLQRKKLEEQGAIFTSTSDTEIILHKIARSKAQKLADKVVEAFHGQEGAYCMLFLSPTEMIAIRDPHGFRPLCMGTLGNSVLFSSETCTFDLLGATYVRDIEPGEMIIVDTNGITSNKPFRSPIKAQCSFEHIYFSRPDSRVFNRSVHATRHLLGATLAQEHPVEADIVVPVPDSGVPAALGYAAQSGIPFCFGLVRNHYVGRTFIEPQDKIRHFRVKIKLNPVRDLLEGKRVVLVDDSIVRGTTSRKIVKIVREFGAKEVHLRISSPPTIAPCFYGIDTPSRRELIAAQKSIKEISEYIGADSLGYLSHQGLLEVCGEESGRKSFCTACFTGNYPTLVHIGEAKTNHREQEILQDQQELFPKLVAV